MQQTCVATKATCAHHRVKAVYSRDFLLEDDVPAGLSARRLDPRSGEQKLHSCTAGLVLDWDGTTRASARFGPSRIFLLVPGRSF